MGEADTLRSELRAAGLSNAAVDAAWPEWWSNEAETSVSARAELRLSVARNLGLSPTLLIGERVDFVWRDRARFKNLDAEGAAPLAALNSFGMSVGRSLIRATADGPKLLGMKALNVRQRLLRYGAPELMGLLAFCWATSTAVAHLRVWPLDRKRMHAMVVGHGSKHAILLTRETAYPAVAAFTLAHEMGHIALGHLPGEDSLVDVEDPAETKDQDDEETAANNFALELLVGDSSPDIRINFTSFNSVELADAVLRASPQYGIDPATLALVIAHSRNAWPVAMAAMRLIYSHQESVAEVVNHAAAQQLDLSRLGGDNRRFIQRTLGLDRD